MYKIAAVAILAFAATGASAATLLTSAAGYTGPTLDIGAYGNNFYTFSAGPLALPGGITYTSTTSGSVIGDGGYGLNDNGGSTDNIVGVNSESDTITLTFATPVAAFGGGFNYAPGFGTPSIAAYDIDGVQIASYDLSALAPISTPGATNAYAFRGIDGDGTAIGSFSLTGSYIILSANATTVPEPATWALMIAGFGLVGVAARRRTAITA